MALIITDILQCNNFLFFIMFILCTTIHRDQGIYYERFVKNNKKGIH